MLTGNTANHSRKCLYVKRKRLNIFKVIQAINVNPVNFGS